MVVAGSDAIVKVTSLTSTGLRTQISIAMARVGSHYVASGPLIVTSNAVVIPPKCDF